MASDVTYKLQTKGIGVEGGFYGGGHSIGTFREIGEEELKKRVGNVEYVRTDEGHNYLVVNGNNLQTNYVGAKELGPNGLKEVLVEGDVIYSPSMVFDRESNKAVRIGAVLEKGDHGYKVGKWLIEVRE